MNNVRFGVSAIICILGMAHTSIAGVTLHGVLKDSTWQGVVPDRRYTVTLQLWSIAGDVSRMSWSDLFVLETRHGEFTLRLDDRYPIPKAGLSEQMHLEFHFNENNESSLPVPLPREVSKSDWVELTEVTTRQMDLITEGLRVKIHLDGRNGRSVVGRLQKPAQSVFRISTGNKGSHDQREVSIKSIHRFQISQTRTNMSSTFGIFGTLIGGGLGYVTTGEEPCTFGDDDCG